MHLVQQIKDKKSNLAVFRSIIKLRSLAFSCYFHVLGFFSTGIWASTILKYPEEQTSTISFLSDEALIDCFVLSSTTFLLPVYWLVAAIHIYFVTFDTYQDKMTF